MNKRYTTYYRISWQILDPLESANGSSVFVIPSKNSRFHHISNFITSIIHCFVWTWLTVKILHTLLNIAITVNYSGIISRTDGCMLLIRTHNR